jgi:membrane protease YdiL (CAAX protease family)
MNFPPEISQQADPPAVSPKPTLHALFFGDDGLRAGWSVLLYLILVAIIGVVATPLMARHGLLPNPAEMPHTPSGQTIMSPGIGAAGETLQLAMFVIPAVLMSFIERRPFTRYGIAFTRMLPDYFAGLFWGFVALSALVGSLYLTHSIAFDGLLLHGATALVYALQWAFVFLLVGLLEEFLFRGYLLYTVSRGVAGITRTMDPRNRYSHIIGFWVSAGLFSVLIFMLAHTGNGGETLSGIIAVGLSGAVFAFSLWRTGSLWWGIGMHTSWDWAQSYFYGTPDSGTISQGRLLASHPIGSKLLSGGPDGPEGSILVIPTLLLVALVIHLTLPRRSYPLTPDQSPLPEPPPLPPAI